MEKCVAAQNAHFGPLLSNEIEIPKNGPRDFLYSSEKYHVQKSAQSDQNCRRRYVLKAKHAQK